MNFDKYEAWVEAELRKLYYKYVEYFEEAEWGSLGGFVFFSLRHLIEQFLQNSDDISLLRSRLEEVLEEVIEDVFNEIRASRKNK